MVDQKELFESKRTPASIRGSARLSGCRNYRYALWRHWNEIGSKRRFVAFIGLNPSTADEETDDPTIRRCIGFAKSWGFNGIYMLNAFAFRATKPVDMKKADDPVGPENEYALKFYTRRVDQIIAAWGAHCPEERERVVFETINKPIFCLGKTKAGRPRHPLYLRSDTKRELLWNLKPDERLAQ